VRCGCVTEQHEEDTLKKFLLTGTGTFKTRTEAETGRKTMKVCTE
jgi:hypothetical protein